MPGGQAELSAKINELSQKSTESVSQLGKIDYFKSDIVAIDIGGTDVKLVAKPNGSNQPIFFKEYNWMPHEIDNADIHVKVFVTLIELGKAALYLNSLDSNSAQVAVLKA